MMLGSDILQRQIDLQKLAGWRLFYYTSHKDSTQLRHIIDRSEMSCCVWSDPGHETEFTTTMIYKSAQIATRIFYLLCNVTIQQW